MAPKNGLRGAGERGPGSARILLLEAAAGCETPVRAYFDGIAPPRPQLETACTLGDALGRLAKGGFDLVLAELDVADSSGLATLDALAAAGAAPVIVLGGADDPASRAVALEHGAHELVCKNALCEATLARLARLARWQANSSRSLRESEARSRSLLALSSDWYWEQDENLRFTRLYGGIFERIQIDPASLVGRYRWENPGVDANSPEWEAHRGALARREPFRDFEYAIRQANGEWLQMSVSGQPVFDEPGRFRGYRGIGRDITAAKRAERDLADSQARKSAILDASMDAVVSMDHRGRVVEFNAAAERHFGYSRDDAIGKDMAELVIPPELREAHREGLARFIATGEGRVIGKRIEVTALRADGSRFDAELAIVRIAGVEPPLFTGTARDITARKAAERLLGLDHEVTRCLASAETVSDALRGVMRAICESQNWQSGRYFHHDEGAAVMRFRDSWCDGSEPMQRFNDASRGLAFAPGAGLVGHAWQAGEPLWIADVSSDLRVAEVALARDAGVHGALVLPVIFEARTIGVLSVSSRTVREPDKQLLRTLQGIASQLGQFLQRKQAEQALRRSMHVLESTFEHMDQGISIADADLQIAGMNRRFRELLDFPESLCKPNTPFAAFIRYNAERGDYGPGDVEEQVRTRVELARRFEPHRFERERPDGTILEIRGGPVPGGGFVTIYTDVTQRARAERALRESEARFRSLTELSSDWYWEQDDQFRFTLLAGPRASANSRSGDPSVYLGKARWEIADMEPVAGDWALHRAQLERHDPLRDVLFRRKMSDGTVRYMSVSGEPVFGEDGRFAGYRGVGRDATHQAAHLRYQEKIARFGQAALVKRDADELIEEALQNVLEGLGADAIAYVEPGPGERNLVLRAVVGVVGSPGPAVAVYAAEDLLAGVLERGEAAVAGGRDRTERLLPFDWAHGLRSAAFVPVRRDRGACGALCALSRHPAAFGADESKFLDAAASVLSAGLQRVDSEVRLAFLAQFDALTGLPNRALLTDRFSQTIVQARRHGRPLGVLFVDLDDFKSVNDTLGHAGGDALLKETARRLESAVRQGDTVARISGDEFAIILADLARTDDAALVGQKIIDRLAAPVEVLGQEVFVTASIGIAAFPGDGSDAETLLAAADAAMYRAKQSGRNAYHFFTPDIDQRTRARARLGSELRHALESEEFALVYQPKFDLKNGRPCGVEALLRWQHPERGVVFPAEFVPVLEETGLIIAAGEWVLRRACEDIKAWQASGMEAMPVAVNLSARQFRQHDLGARICSLVQAAGVDPALIELEITESQLMHDPDHAIRIMRALRDAGIRLAIDDFGTGYSSLAYLTRFPVAALKIDRSFVANVFSEPSAATIVRTIIEMAHTLGFTVIAEGVEEKRQAAFLREFGCDQAQGYLFARPVPAADLKALLCSAA